MNEIICMFIKNFIYKIRKDLSRLFIYPVFDISDKKVDYDKYWEKKRKGVSTSQLSSWQRQRAEHIIKLIENDSTVMDLGCGDGAILKYLKDKSGIIGIGVDISSSELRKAEELGFKTIKIDFSNLEELKNLPEADYILGLEIIEHLPNTEEFINLISSKTRNSLIFSIPNTGYYVHRLRLLFGRFPLQWVSHPGEHLRFWTVRDVKWWIFSMGYILDKMIIYEGLPILNKIFPNLFGQGIIIKINKKR